ncbi:aldehyde dehydrogenase family protein [Conexibacter arvalis]|uniref:L-glutamate gamma-semialdehyde dehydrogenase n=1 Tax=Conexibacter arvalis TaxID=912552 RepID=A0A840IB65_9ACTN|nr:aldehyde dehydrogenase family protein [Conexibacter arvalis]MBB4661318.1 RHH-type proline utilization regulon transcriptional repressor/proline dehydrogenase/delta 1-pyrroline-5-carboxylate dehydrogenase [Conexibacter arvalis]
MSAPFRNEPLLELRRASVRDELRGALAALDARLPLEVPVAIGGERRHAPVLDSVDPGRPERVVARATVATGADVDAAVAIAAQAVGAWRDAPAGERAAVLARAAGELRGRRRELAALCVREVGKPWPEADADVAEAIDFLEFYGRQAVALEARAELEQLPGERNTLRHRGRGVAAVIAPWNFPLAIATGMTAAALAAGNAALLKPAEQSPGCALALAQALERAGLPAGLFALLPGAGEVGAALVRHPGVHTIAFTGSGAVGLEIVERAARVAPGQRHLKRVVAEMGGKNCTLVDRDADLDDAVPALLASAFGYAGQKCSATARALVHERLHAPLLERLRGALDTLSVGPADDFASDLGPLIEADARDRVEGALRDAAAAGARVDRTVGELPDDGWFVAPAVVAGAPADGAVVRAELFGPVLSVEPVRGMEEACDRVDEQSYALTGGLFSRDPRTIELVSRRTPVGNLYVNRGTTGAMVARQPFGGNRLSGTGTKAGGPDYLLQFIEPVVICENTVRHGLTFG